MKHSFKLLLALAIIFTLLFGAWASVRIVKAVSFSLGCESYLKRAAGANTVDMAKTELDRAIAYAEQHGLTEGVVSIFVRNPANDIGFWYRNLKAASDEIGGLPADTTPLEKTNVLMKLRESLTDRDNGNTQVVHPFGISVYPDNSLYFAWAAVSLAGLCVFWSLFIVFISKQYLARHKESQV